MEYKDAILEIRKNICNEKQPQKHCTDRCMYGKEFCAFSLAISTMQRAIPLEPHMYIGIDGFERRGCPRCWSERGRNEILYAGQKYCSVCGQAIRFQ